ncbi:MAG: hypothetical protein O3C28_02655 [Proteobacteria bacterium]|nr:hypothetical protein [Pseudomonadota bacterium]
MIRVEDPDSLPPETIFCARAKYDLAAWFNRKLCSRSIQAFQIFNDDVTVRAASYNGMMWGYGFI